MVLGLIAPLFGMFRSFMKFILLLLLPVTALAQGDLSANLRGQTQTAKLTVGTIEVPNNQAVKTGSISALINTGNTNILADSSFEGRNSPLVWDVGNGTTTYTTTAIDGRYSLTKTLSSQTLSVDQDSTTYETQFADGVQGLALMYVRTSISSTPIYLCPRRAGSLPAQLSSSCVTIQPSGKWGLYKVPFILGGTGNGIELTSNGVSITGTVEIDNAFLGAVDLSAETNNVGNWTSFTPTGSWTTNTTYTGKYRQVGENIEFDVRVATSGAPNSATLSVNLPNGWTVDSTKMTALATELFNYQSDGIVSDSGSRTAMSKGTYLTTSTVLFTYDTGAGSNGNITQASPFTFGSGDFVQVSFTLPITQFTSSGSVYSSTNADTGWASCGHTTSDFNGFGTVSNIETQCKRSGDDLLMRGKFTAGTSTAVEARVNLKLGGVTLTSKNSTVLPSIQIAGKANNNGSSTTFFSGLVALMEPSVSYITFGTETSTANGLTKQLGNVFTGSGTVVAFRAQVPISNWEQSNIIIGSFNEAVTTPGVTKPVLCSAKISATGVISDQKGGCFASCTNATSPVCTFTSGYWVSGQVPNCWFVSSYTGANNYQGFKITTTTTFTGNIYLASNTVTAGEREYFCHGERQ